MSSLKTTTTTTTTGSVQQHTESPNHSLIYGITEIGLHIKGRVLAMLLLLCTGCNIDHLTTVYTKFNIKKPVPKELNIICAMGNFVAYSPVYWLNRFVDIYPYCNVLLFLFPVCLVFRDYGADVSDSMCS